MMDLFTLKQQIIDTTELAAMAVLRLQNPAFDEVKLNDAYRIAGNRWLKYHIKAGNIKPIRRGTAKNSPIYYSRLDIAALKKAEKWQNEKPVHFISRNTTKGLGNTVSTANGL